MASIDDREYWDKRQAKLDADMAEAVRPKSLSERLQVALRYANAIPGDDTHAAEWAAAEAKVAGLKVEIEAEQLAHREAEWTRELTIARRATWNAALRDPRYRTTNGKSVLVGKIESELDYTMDGLKWAIAKWQL